MKKGLARGVLIAAVLTSLAALPGCSIARDVAKSVLQSEMEAEATETEATEPETTEPETTKTEEETALETEAPETEAETTEEETDEAETTESETDEAEPLKEELSQHQEYIFPDSNTRYLSEKEVGVLSPTNVRLARNEIYARHGRRFQAEDLQEYFDGMVWYSGTIEPGDFDENVLNVYEKKNAQLLSETGGVAGLKGVQEAAWKRTIDRYGYEDGHSVLTFELQTRNGLVDHGGYWQMPATYYQGVEAPGNLRIGDTVTLVFDELTGDTQTLEYRKEGLVETKYPQGTVQYYYTPSEDGSPVMLYQDSDDRVNKRILLWWLYVRKDATEEIAIAQEVRPVTEEILKKEHICYNGVYFDTKGYVTRLVYYGD